jgi:hypothetical protein
MQAAADTFKTLGTPDNLRRVGRGGVTLPTATDLLRNRFLEASEGLAKNWKAYQDQSVAFMKSEAKRVGDDWKTGGGADLAGGLPDVTAALSDWQKQKERNPFDTAALADSADKLATAVKTAQDYVQSRDSQFPGDSEGMLRRGLQALGDELARQATTLVDPVASTTAAFDALTPLPDTVMAPGSELKGRLETQAKQLKPGDFWDYAKTGCTNLIAMKDKKFAKSVTSALDANLKGSLATFAKATTAKKKDGAAILAASRDVATTLQAYEERLAALQDTKGVSMSGSGGVAGLREALRLIGASVSNEVKFLDANGAFGPGR